MDVNLLSENISSESNEDVAPKKNFACPQTLRKKMKRIPCKICGKQYGVYYLKYHQKKHSNLRAYKCEFCCSSFNYENSLQRHRLKIHSDKSEKQKGVDFWTCKVCKKVFENRYKYKQHLWNHKQETSKATCKLCDKVLKKRYLGRHMVMVHSSRPYSCGICQKRFAYTSKLNSHSKTHTGDNSFRNKKSKQQFSTECHICNKMLSCAKSLETHYHLEHKSYRPYQCGECQKTYCSEKILKYHMQKHVKGKSFHCLVCTKTFPTEYHLKRHSIIHNKKFECGICHAKYSSPYGLKKHIEKHQVNAQLHTSFENHQVNAQPHPSFCKICNKPFKNLVSHMQKHRQTATYKCNICSKTYSNVKKACIHIIDKLLRCDLCFKIFVTKKQHEKHLLLCSHLAREKNSKPKPVKKCDNSKPRPMKKCDDCNMEFSDKSAYKQHRESHDPNKQFCCEYCHERFYSFTKLYKHLGKHNGYN